MNASTLSDPALLRAWGWDDRFDASYRTCCESLCHTHRELSEPPLDVAPARVCRVDRGACDVVAALGAARATFSGAVLGAAAEDPAEAPCVGDWVVLRSWPDGRITAEAVLPRRSAFIRNSVAPGSSKRQVLAANVDTAVIVEGLLPEPDLGRIERLLALAWESGARPVVVLTKADLVPDADELRAEVAAGAPGVDVYSVSSKSGSGMAELSLLLTPGRTLALLGPSGAGKSTLTNAFAGAELMPTRELRADGKGRHTTVHRELVQLPNGALIVDTPGLRSIGLTDVAEALDLVFADIEALAAECRFADCGHNGEPGCEVLAAVEDGTLPERRLDSWRKLQREARWIASRQDARLRAEERAKWKSIQKAVRGRSRP